jgi:hypothetical protein
MNAKEQIIRLLKREIAYFKASDLDTTELYNIIAATESAIFDVPSEDEIENKANLFKHEYYQGGFHDGCDFILNYKKPEPNEK